MEAKENAMFSLDGEAALITGASSGLGRHFAHVLARAGADVVLAARRKDRLAHVAAEIEAENGKASGSKVMFVTMDVTDAESIADGFEAAEHALGAMTILVNNAGMVTSGAALDQTEEDWDAVIDTNLKGAWLCAREAARRMIAAETAGAIVNIASIAGVGVEKGIAPYAVSKAGVIHMTRVLALEWARHGIRVNGLAPGYIETDLNRDFLQSDAGRAMMKRIPQRRFGLPQDLDGPLLLLASEASAHITGVVIPIDGGHLVGSL